MYVLPSIATLTLFYSVHMYVDQVGGECMLAELLKNGTEGSSTVGCSQEPHKRIFSASVVCYTCSGEHTSSPHACMLDSWLDLWLHQLASCQMTNIQHYLPHQQREQTVPCMQLELVQYFLILSLSLSATLHVPQGKDVDACSQSTCTYTRSLSLPSLSLRHTEN